MSNEKKDYTLAIDCGEKILQIEGFTKEEMVDIVNRILPDEELRILSPKKKNRFQRIYRIKESGKKGI